MTNDELHQFAIEVQSQTALYKEMIALNAEQQSLLKQERHNPDDLLALVGRKQHFMNEVSQIETRIKPLKEAWPESREALEANVREEMDGLIRTLSETIKSLIAMEDEAQKLIESVISATKSSIVRIQHKSQINRAYAAYAGNQANPRFVDKRSDEH